MTRVHRCTGPTGSTTTRFVRPPATCSLFRTPGRRGTWTPRPMRCVKTRPTSQGNDLTEGLNGRVYDPTDPNPSPQPPTCARTKWEPATSRDRTTGSTTPTTPVFGYQELSGSRRSRTLTHFAPRPPASHHLPDDPRVLHRSGQNSYPITGSDRCLHHRLRTGVGQRRRPDRTDPCAGRFRRPSTVLRGHKGGNVIWGHFVNPTVLSATATPSGARCNPVASSSVRARPSRIARGARAVLGG